MLRDFLLFIGAILLSGCATLQDVHMARMHINQVWKAENQKINMDIGTITVDSKPEIVYEAIIKTLVKVGFSIEKGKEQVGVIYAVAQAPTPLSDEEWEEVKKIEEPKTKKIASKYLGLSSIFAGLHTDGVQIHIISFIKPTYNGTQVSFEYVLYDYKAKAMGLDPNTYAPPLAAKMGTVKVLKEFNEQLRLIENERNKKKENVGSKFN